MEYRYELRFSDVTPPTESHGYIVRWAPNTAGTGKSGGRITGSTPKQHAAFEEAIKLVGRNAPGDRGRAVAVLSSVYPQVELDLSLAPPSDPSELGLVITGPDAEVMVRTDGTVWSKAPHAEWSQESIRSDVGKQIYTALKRQRAKMGWLKRRLSEHEKESLRDVDYGIYTPSELLELIHDEAKRRLFSTSPAIASKYREVTDVEGDQFNLILAATGLPVPITCRADLEEHLPNVTGSSPQHT